jgi:hypothetical protein
VYRHEGVFKNSFVILWQFGAIYRQSLLAGITYGNIADGKSFRVVDTTDISPDFIRLGREQVSYVVRILTHGLEVFIGLRCKYGLCYFNAVVLAYASVHIRYLSYGKIFDLSSDRFVFPEEGYPKQVRFSSIDTYRLAAEP